MEFYVETSCVAGLLVRVETVAVPVGRAGQLDGSVTRWTESSNEDKLYMFILRVYTTSRVSNVGTLKHMCLGLSSTSFTDSFSHRSLHAYSLAQSLSFLAANTFMCLFCY